MKYRRFASVPVFSVLWLMGFVYYTTVYVFIEDWVGLQSSPGSLNTYIFASIAVLSLFSFIACVFIDPGHVSSSYVPEVEEDGGSDRETRNNNMQMKHCDKCSKYKPPRAHHCRTCKRCVLRMDHHCIWINNCVGYRNYKAFSIFIIYTTLASIYSTSMIVICTLRKDWEFDGRGPIKFFYFSFGLMMVALSFTLGSLLGWHIYLMAHNMTTIEYYEGKRAAWLARKSGQSYRHPYDLGVYKNITLVLGPNMLNWLIPTAVSHLQDGTNFPTTRSS